jgi:L-cystine uptake protein TcyP (sodium:dicarboxylate symporter family)
MAINIILNQLVALIVFAFMFHQQRKHATFTVRVFTGLGLGVLLGAAAQWLYGAGSPSSRAPMNTSTSSAAAT